MQRHGLGWMNTVCLMSPLLLACGSPGDDATTNPTLPTTVNPSGINPSAADSTTDDTNTDTGTPTTGPTGGDTRDSVGATTDDPPTTQPETDGPACSETDCAVGEHCDAGTDTCVPGCNDDADCMGDGVCDGATNQCTGCVTDLDCPLGTVCSAGACVPGCTDMQPCPNGLACCDGQCTDLLSDPAHCGICTACTAPDHAEASCADGLCGLGACAVGFNDCDGNPNNGCENSGACQCTPNEQVPCYSGPDGTQNQGVCVGGTQTCNAEGTGFGDCIGEVLPGPEELCANGIDDDCNGQTDEDPDEDGDGWTKCGGDCCDVVGPTCLTPNLVNPGAFDVPANMVDDDCDGNQDNQIPACDGGLASNSGTGTDYAKAIDLCQFTEENPPIAMKKWGVISAGITRADGNQAAFAGGKSIRSGFGTGGIVPQKNSNLAIFSTGSAADQADANPGYSDFQTGLDTGLNSNAPADWLAANGGAFPNAPGCPGPASTAANNSQMLKIRVRVPTNAQSFNVQMHFFSAEWPEYACTAFNDLFVTLVDSQGANPADKNIAIYTTPNNQKYPVGVNIAKAAAGLFTECQNGQAGCVGTAFNYNNCSAGTGPLAGTGFQTTNDSGCNGNNTTGGGTGWLKMAGNVKPGETMEIRFAIWDTSDGVWDSLVLLDAWEWSVQASQPGVQPN